MMIPTAHPIVVPLPSLVHRQFCVAGLARGHPDSGEAAIMGVPLPHLVLPLSGCLNRRTPTKATRSEARGHRSVLAQNPLLMHPLLFSFLGLVVGSVCPREMVEWSPMCLRCCGYTPCRGSFDRVTLWTCGSLKGTQRDDLGCVCVCWLRIVSRCGCRPASAMPTPS